MGVLEGSQFGVYICICIHIYTHTHIGVGLLEGSEFGVKDNVDAYPWSNME